MEENKTVIDIDNDCARLTSIPTPQFSTTISNIRVKIEKLDCQMVIAIKIFSLSSY